MVHSKTQRMRRHWVKKQKSKCAICKKKINFRTATLDHIIPLSKGGLNEVINTQATCSYCNKQKSDRLTGIEIDIVAQRMKKKEGIVLQQLERIRMLGKYGAHAW